VTIPYLFFKAGIAYLRLFLAFPEADRVEYLTILSIDPTTATEDKSIERK